MRTILLGITLSFTLALTACYSNTSKDDGASAPSQTTPSRSNRY